ncbi:methylglyoxal reductase (NADPH-dependent) gre2 [Tulasnella sp. JGI-2019a]|nr:methylglyoxal reductase (NADPH-dependent) gre2 [Tulasnella sp. JGI-2019a]
MPAVSAPTKVLVTGASGFIAVWVCKTLLDQGYHVVGTVRSKSKGEYLQNLFEKDHGKDKFTFIIVADMQEEGAFDKAVVGVDAVEHTASPVTIMADDPQELIQPAVKGTIGVLESIQKHAPNVKRIVITSTLGSIIHDKGSNKLFDETDWNTTSPREVEEKGRDATGMHKYRTSKVMAERAAWDFVDKNKTTFDLVTVCPPMVFGPVIHDVSSPAAFNTSMASFMSHTTPGQQGDLLGAAGSWVDVRDLASIHAWALSNPAAGGERFIACAGAYTMQGVLDVLHKEKPGRTDVPIGTPGKPTPGRTELDGVVFSSAKAQRVFDMKFRSLAEMAPDALQSLKDKGLRD